MPPKLPVAGTTDADGFGAHVGAGEGNQNGVAQAREGQADEDRLAEQHVEQSHEAFASEPVRGGKAGHHDAGDEQQGEPIGLSGHVA